MPRLGSGEMPRPDGGSALSARTTALEAEAKYRPGGGGRPRPSQAQAQQSSPGLN